MVDVVSLRFCTSTPLLWKLHDGFLEPLFWCSAAPLVDNTLQGICILKVPSFCRRQRNLRGLNLESREDVGGPYTQVHPVEPLSVWTSVSQSFLNGPSTFHCVHACLSTIWNNCLLDGTACTVHCHLLAFCTTTHTLLITIVSYKILPATSE
jgi:hypothetical protein